MSATTITSKNHSKLQQLFTWYFVNSWCKEHCKHSFEILPIVETKQNIYLEINFENDNDLMLFKLSFPENLIN
jgi:hypothetical protein